MIKRADDQPGFRFRGFRRPNYTMVPDEVFDELLTVLTGAELKVLLYIIRRTFGFKKDSDHISLSQMLNGITTREGKTLDKGAGLSKPTLLGALRSLTQMKIVLATRHSSPEKGDQPTEYQLHFLGSDGGQESVTPVVTKPDQGGGQETPPGSRSSGLTTQETGEQETEYSNLRERKESEEPAQAAGSTPSGVPEDSAGLNSLRALLANRRRPSRHGRDEDRGVILDYITDLAREFNDQAPLTSSVSRAMNLYRESGLSLEAFIGKLMEARTLTKERSASIRATEPGDGRPSPWGKRKTRMGYYFGVLRDRLGLAE